MQRGAFLAHCVIYAAWGIFFSRVSAQAMSSSPWAFVREALPLDDRQEEWLCSGERRVSQGLL